MEESTIQKALRAWVRRSSGLEDQKIFWAQQGNVQPEGQYITMLMGNLIPLGSVDEQDHEYEALTEEEEAALTEDEIPQDITITVTGRRQFSLSVQCFGDDALTSYALLSKVQTSLELPSYISDFDEEDISCFNKGQIQNVTILKETDFEPRSLCEFQFYCTETVSEQTTYIKTVSLENDIVEPPTTFEVTITE